MKWIRERFAGCKLTEKVLIIDEAFYTNRNVQRQGRECESFQGVDSLLVHIEGGRTLRKDRNRSCYVEFS